MTPLRACSGQRPLFVAAGFILSAILAENILCQVAKKFLTFVPSVQNQDAIAGQVKLACPTYFAQILDSIICRFNCFFE